MRFYAIMHWTTIVQNKLISIICSCLFFPVNIYSPSLGKVWLGRLNQTPLQGLNFYLRRKKKHSAPNCMHYNASLHNFQFWFSFIFKKVKKTIYIIIMNIIFFLNIPTMSCSEVFVNAIYFTSLRWIMNACSGFET